MKIGDPQAQEPPRVAVVAVHGVAEHEPGSTVTQVADQLLRFHGADYTPFERVGVRIGVEPLKLVKLEVPNEERGGFVDELFREAGLYTRRCSQGTAVLKQPDHGFMRDLLRKYENTPPTVHEAVCLKGKRTGSKNGCGQGDVDFYEMYYDDLSRLSGGFARVFGELYQLLFHLTDLGRQTVDLARGAVRDAERDELRLSPGGQRVWSVFSGLQTWTGRALTIPIALLNLILLAVVLLFPVLAISGTAQKVIAIGLPVIATFVGIMCLGWRLLPFYEPAPRAMGRWQWFGWIPLSLLGAVGAGVLAHYIAKPTVCGPYHLLGWEWCILAGLLLFVIASQFNTQRPGALGFTVVFGSAMLAALWYAIAAQRRDSQQAVAGAALPVIESIFLLLVGFWALFAVLHLLTRVFGFWAIAVTPEKKKDGCAVEQRALAHRVAWTSAISLAVPAALFLVMTLVGWMGLSIALRSAIPPQLNYVEGPEYRIKDAQGNVIIDENDNPVNPFPRALSGTFPSALMSGYSTEAFEKDWNVIYVEKDSQGNALPLEKQPGTAGAFLQALIVASGTPLLPWALGLIGAAVILGAVALTPSILAEVRMGKRPGDMNEANRQAGRIGWWMSNGYILGRVAGELVFVATAIVLPVGAFLMWRGQVVPLDTTRTILFALGGTLATSAVGLAAFRGQLDKIAVGFRRPVDVALDVDNHLRDLPQASTPRAKMCARYASLLRHLCDPALNYKAVVIVAHSQGTVLSADLLRFLHFESDLVKGQRKDEIWRPGVPEAKRQVEDKQYEKRLQPLLTGALPLYLFTMGSPLRQLYGLRFPHLYEWARHTDQISDPPAPEPAIEPDRGPSPKELGAKLWVNCFRSGDYVGRFLWRGEASTKLFDSSVSEDNTPATRREFCVGAGAHSHYFDASAEEVARELDLLIQTALT